MLSNGFYKIIRYCTSIMLYYITLSFCNIIILVLLVLLVPTFFNGVATDCFIEIRGIHVLLKSLPDLFDTIMKNLPTTASSIFFYFGNFSAPPVDKETYYPRSIRNKLLSNAYTWWTILPKPWFGNKLSTSSTNIKHMDIEVGTQYLRWW